VAVATYGDVNTQVVQAYYAQWAISPLPSVDKVTFNGKPLLNDDSAGETSLDAEMIGMMAPGASIHIFTSAANNDAGEMALFTAILDDGRSKVVNYSWGGCEPQLTAKHAAEMGKVFARALAQGVNILVASGDQGSDSCNNKTVAADWPAAHPDVVAVGGTTLTPMNGYFDETAWSLGGGGISKKWALPAYQNGLGLSKRAYPDVAFNADPSVSPEPIYIQVKGQQGWAAVGGTSMASPQWAGFLALVNAARAAQGKAALGFLNPIIYGLSAANRAVAFNDVTNGSNGAYSAATGFDEVSGWGSMNGEQLAPLLIAQ
jgi:kumamolisin